MTVFKLTHAQACGAGLGTVLSGLTVTPKDRGALVAGVIQFVLAFVLIGAYQSRQCAPGLTAP